MSSSVPYQIPKVVISYLFPRWRGRASTGKDLRSQNAQRGGEEKWQEVLVRHVKLLESVGAWLGGVALRVKVAILKSPK